MGENVNKKIIEKIKASNLDESVKKFLIDVLRFELQHFEEEKPRFSEEYERLIKNYAGRLEVTE